MCVGLGLGVSAVMAYSGGNTLRGAFAKTSQADTFDLRDGRMTRLVTMPDRTEVMYVFNFATKVVVKNAQGSMTRQSFDAAQSAQTVDINDVYQSACNHAALIGEDGFAAVYCPGFK